MTAIKIDPSLCIGCGECAADCVSRNIAVEGGKARVLGTACIGCGHCYAVCPAGAVSMPDYDCSGLEETVSLTEFNPRRLLLAMESRRSARRFTPEPVSEEALRLIEVTRQSFFEGIKYAKPGYRVSDIGHAIQEYVESHGFSVVRAYEGHGVGAKLHEEPEIPNFGEPGHGPRLVKGMTLAIEPMVNAGTWEVYVLDNDWTAVTSDGKLSAHYENTVLITDGEPEILTMAEDM